MEVFFGNTKVNPWKLNWNNIGGHIPYTFRQRAGKDNPLGQFKFYLSNSYWIYLHDSNEKYLFETNHRALSHGCIRVEKARVLAEYLLRNQKGWDADRLDHLLGKVTDYGISVKPKVPVFIVYLTAWVNDKGVLNLRNDVYERDSVLAEAVFGQR
jgi:murein L,D-transpeptidase YcbB/YkuD